MEILGKGIFFYSTTKGNEWLRKVELKIDWAEKLNSQCNFNKLIIFFN